MKRLSFLLTTAVVFMIVFAAQAQTTKQVANRSQDAPYKVDYTNLSIGNQQYAKQVLNAWKAYDNNSLDDIAPLIADDITATLPDGTVIKGKENFLNGLKTYRGGFTSVMSTVDACTTLKSPDHPEHEVALIWGTEADTKQDGTTQRTAIHEVWFFNHQGKVTEFHQFAAAIQQQ